MRHRPLPPEFHAEKRRRAAAALPPDAFAVLHSAEVPRRSADGTTRFIQDSDLYYLTGIDQEDTALILCPGHPDPALREQLFVRETSPLIAVWEGHKLSLEEAAAVSGIPTVRWSEAFEPALRRCARDFPAIHLNHNEHARADSSLHLTPDDRFRERCQGLYPQHRYGRLAPVLHRLRAEKAPCEIEQIRSACGITEQGFRRILGLVEPGLREYEIEAELLHEFLRHGSRGFAYEPIVASGANSNVLHYIHNDQVCREGDLLLLDVGAEYGNYNADLTRTIPVSGSFSPRQRAVYDAVLRLLRACIDRLIVPGKKIREEFMRELALLAEDELVALGLLEAETVAREREDEELPFEKRSFRQYFMHGASHSLGLDVHDVTPAEAAFVENMCVTVEPGFYLPDEGFGIRLENDIVVRTGGNLDLMASIPIEAEEIEALMGRRG